MHHASMANYIPNDLLQSSHVSYNDFWWKTGYKPVKSDIDQWFKSIFSFHKNSNNRMNMQN